MTDSNAQSSGSLKATVSQGYILCVVGHEGSVLPKT